MNEKIYPRPEKTLEQARMEAVVVNLLNDEEKFEKIYHRALIRIDKSRHSPGRITKQMISIMLSGNKMHFEAEDIKRLFDEFRSRFLEKIYPLNKKIKQNTDLGYTTQDPAPRKHIQKNLF